MYFEGFTAWDFLQDDLVAWALLRWEVGSGTFVRSKLVGAPVVFVAHRIHGTGILVYLPYIYHKNRQNVGKYTSPMDPTGRRVSFCLIGCGTEPHI